MAYHARYTTFRSGELEAQIRALGGSLGSPLGPPCSTSSQGRGSRLLKAHACAVHYPDGTGGVCRYERCGPAWHLFRYECLSANGPVQKTELLPKQYWSTPLGNDAASIEAKAKELAEVAFNEAISREQREFFMRASEGAGRKKHPALFSMTAQKAKRMAGRYALCRKLGEALVPVGGTFASLQDANTAWLAQGDTGLIVGCCNRLDRCWQRPRYQPLHADPRYGNLNGYGNPNGNPNNAPLAESTIGCTGPTCPEKGD